MTWKEKVKVPNIEKVHVKEGCDNPCEECENWGETCETCNVAVPLVCDELETEEITMGVVTCCGIPMGHAYEVRGA